MSDHIFKTFRAKHRLSQSALGESMGLDPTRAQGRVSHYETRRLEIPIDIAYAFIEVAATYGDSFSLEDLYPPPQEVA